MSDPGFVHLHVHSSYSLLEGALTISKLAELAKADRQPALALTDTDNMFGALEFSDKLSGSGIQPQATTVAAIRSLHLAVMALAMAPPCDTPSR